MHLELASSSAEPAVRSRVVVPGPPPGGEFGALEDMARVLTASGWYRVARRFQGRERYEAEDGSPTKTALFVDVETTGRDPAEDAIVELAAVPFEYCPADGRVFGVGKPATFTEDPGRPIPEWLTEMTGITDDDVRGRRIDDRAVGALVERASLVIAHNAAFDRKFLERRLPVFAGKPWACSQTEVPWDRHGCAGTKLEYLLVQLCGEFMVAHRAEEDCQVGIHILAMRSHTGELPLWQLLQSARTKTARIWALDAPFEHRESLKARRYRWCDGGGGKPRGWYVDVPQPRASAECEWLTSRVYAGREPAWTLETYSATERFSARI